MKGMAALAFGLVAVSCNKSDIFNPYQQQEENQKKSEAAFAENVMDGQAIDPNQTWSTANAMEVSVTPSATGTLKIYAANPIGNVVAPLYTANVTAGAQTTFTVTKPADVQTLYATVYKAEGQIVNLQAFDATGSKGEVNFNSTTGNRAARRAAPERPSVPGYVKETNPISTLGNKTQTVSRDDMPSAQQTDVVIQGEVTTNWYPNDYSKYDRVYIAPGAVLTLGDSGFKNGAKIYMSSNSKIVGTSKTLSLGSNTVLYNDGGVIELYDLNLEGCTLWNKGTITLSNGMWYSANSPAYVYNSGTISAKNGCSLNKNGILYNTGTFTSTNGDLASAAADNTTSAPYVYNSGSISTKNISLNKYATLWDEGTVTVDGNFIASNDEVKIYVASGHRISAGYLELSTIDQVLWNKGTVDIDGKILVSKGTSTVFNYGTITGDSFDNSAGAKFYNATNAQVEISGETHVDNSNSPWVNDGTYTTGTFRVTGGSTKVFNNCRLTVNDKFIIGGDGSYFILQGDASVVCKKDFDWNGDAYFWMGANSLLLVNNKLKSNNINDDGKGFHQFGENPAVISARVISTDNEEGQGRICLYGNLYVDADSMFTLKEIGGKNNYVTEGEVTFTRKQFNAQVPDSWKTPTTCRPAYVPQKTVNDQVMYYYYAFEDLGTTNDFDFNDVVIRVSAPINGTSTVQLMCAGGTMSTKVTYGETILCKEVHAAFGVDNIKDMINTGAGPEKTFVTLGTINPPANTDMSRLPFGITCQGNEGQVIRVERSVANNVKAPLLIVVNGYPKGEDAGKWFWPREYINIVNPYEQFGAWGANVQSNANWYLNYKEKDKDGKLILYKW